jgi:sialate O-acetylesterase
MKLVIVLAYTLTLAAAAFNLSNTLGDSMVLQRAPQAAVVWGFGDAGSEITTTFQGKTLTPVKVDATGVWRQHLPPTAASKTPTTIAFSGSDGSKAELKDVLFGDVYLCSGQSNSK